MHNPWLADRTEFQQLLKQVLALVRAKMACEDPVGTSTDDLDLEVASRASLEAGISALKLCEARRKRTNSELYMYKLFL